MWISNHFDRLTGFCRTRVWARIMSPVAASGALAGLMTVRHPYATRRYNWRGVNVMNNQLIQTAIRHHQAGRLAEAEKAYRMVLAQQPDQADVLNFLGMLCAQTGRLQEGVKLLRRAIQIMPQSAEAHRHLGFALRNQGRLKEAVESYQRAIRLKPDFAAAHNNLGVALAQMGNFTEAVAAHRQAIQFKPEFSEAHNNLGITLAKTGQIDEAIASLREALRLSPNNADAYSNLGNALKNRGQLQEAVDACREAIRLKPDGVEAYNNLGIALVGMAKLEEGIAAYRQAIALRPDHAGAHNNLGNALKSMGVCNEAAASFREAIRFAPNFVEAHSNLVLALNYDAEKNPAKIAEEHRAWGHRHADPLGRAIPAHENDRSPDRPLRIGYVSADFRRHPVGFFFMPLLEKHHRENFEIFCYYNSFGGDDFTRRMSQDCKVWRNVTGESDEQVAQLIRSDRIDILVDLSGHTSGNRLKVFARKPAPVQVSYLGYANTTGLPVIDYRLTDAHADPPGMTEGLNVEKLWRLPGCAWCFSPPENSPAVKEREEGPITFGCFNAFAKINPKIVTIWARLLERVSGSRLVLKSAGAGAESSRGRVMRQFAELGIAGDRVEMLGWMDQPLRHLETYHRIDVALDTFPYHGTTTTCEALWMGAPVVTLAGRSHVSRVGVSLLSAVGLEELVAGDEQEYISIAVALASDSKRLAALRAGLRQRMQSSVLMDAAGFAANVESAYREMWKQWCEPKP